MLSNLTIEERFERLGATADVAERLAGNGFTPSLVIGIDHPDPLAFVADEDIHDGDDIDLLIEERYPRFDPDVLDRLSQCPWPINHWVYDFFTFPGPVNRVCMLAEAGVSHKLADWLRWRQEAGVEILDRLNVWMPDPEQIHPVTVRLDDIEYTFSVDGVELNKPAQSLLAYTILSQERHPAMMPYTIWGHATCSIWPVSLMRFPLNDWADLFVDDAEVVGASPLRRLMSIWDAVMLQRLSEVAPSIPDFETAFAAEHPSWAQ